MSDNTEKAGIDPDEFAAAEKEAEKSKDTYTHTFSKPFSYMGKTYTELRFDWDSLNGGDSLDIEEEILQVFGRAVIAEEFNGEYIIRFAAKACAEKIGSDALKLMPVKDFKRIKSRARSFLMAVE